MIIKNTLKKKRRIQRFITHPEQRISFLKGATANGEMEISPDKSYQIMIEVSDYKGNTSYVEAYLTGTATNLNSFDKSNLIDPSKDYLFDFDDRSVYFPQNSFYDAIPLKVENTETELIVGENHYPLQKPFEVQFQIPVQDSLKNSQSFIAMLNTKGKPFFLAIKKKRTVGLVSPKHLEDLPSVETVSRLSLNL